MEYWFRGHERDAAIGRRPFRPRDSMPGMMDTILNLGLNDQTVLALAKPRITISSPGTVSPVYSDGDVVLGVQKSPGEDHEPFETVIGGLKNERCGNHDIEDTKLTAEDLKELVARFKQLVKERTGKDFPTDPWNQLKGAIGAVFGSWMNDRAIVYRQKYNIPREWGTAVNVQAMVFGNTGENSGSGVAFTRDPATGEKVFYGEFLMNAQGEDVVAGVRTPEPVQKLAKQQPAAHADSTAYAKSSSRTSRTCRISSSPSRMARSSCSKPATASAPESPRFASPVRW